MSGAEPLTPSAAPAVPTPSRFWMIALVLLLAVAAASLTLAPREND